MRTRIDISQLVASMAREEARLLEEPFLAPCVAGGTVRVRVGGLVRTFEPSPRDFEGWGIFLQDDERSAVAVDEAPLPLVDRYMSLFEPIRLVLSLRVNGGTWLAVPANLSDARQRGVRAGPVAVHLVDSVSAFERVVARWDGGTLWFEALDTRAGPLVAERLREALRNRVGAAEVRIPGATPEHRIALEVAAAGRVDLLAPRRHASRRATPVSREYEPEPKPDPNVERLDAALERGGGRLVEYREQGDLLVVEWTAPSGERHTSAVTRDDLTVVSSGICLSGRDRDFDLLSLVGVVENRD